MADDKCPTCTEKNVETSKWLLLLYIIVGVLIFLYIRKKNQEQKALAGTLGALSMPIDPAELARGMLVEIPKTNDLDVARKRAVDHILEDPLYYTNLDKMEL